MNKTLLFLITFLLAFDLAFAQAPSTKTVSVSMDTNGVVVSAVTKMGIGYLPPQYPLDVNGDSRLHGNVIVDGTSKEITLRTSTGVTNARHCTRLAQ